MKKLPHLFDNNKAWAAKITQQDPEFFLRLANQQSPEYLWIGCSDSRVPANQLLGLLPGDIFVHRNIANLVVHTDLNCLSVMQFAVDILKVKHIIVCGHYGCKGVGTALTKDRIGLSDNWIRHIKDIRDKHEARLAAKAPGAEAASRLVELNVIEQVANICQTTIAQDAWDRGQELSIHGWVYGVTDGLLRDLSTTISAAQEAEPIYREALGKLS